MASGGCNFVGPALLSLVEANEAAVNTYPMEEHSTATWGAAVEGCLQLLAAWNDRRMACPPRDGSEAHSRRTKKVEETTNGGDTEAILHRLRSSFSNAVISFGAR